jgi:hypothetical protein
VAAAGGPARGYSLPARRFEETGRPGGASTWPESDGPAETLDGTEVSLPAHRPDFEERDGVRRTGSPSGLGPHRGLRSIVFHRMDPRGTIRQTGGPWKSSEQWAFGREPRPAGIGVRACMSLHQDLVREVLAVEVERLEPELSQLRLWPSRPSLGPVGGRL